MSYCRSLVRVKKAEPFPGAAAVLTQVVGTFTNADGR